VIDHRLAPQQAALLLRLVQLRPPRLPRPVHRLDRRRLPRVNLPARALVDGGSALRLRLCDSLLVIN
jgi:hypothetical protein